MNTIDVGNGGTEFFAPAGWAIEVTFVARPQVSIAGRTPVFFAVCDANPSDTFATGDVTIAQDDATGEVTLTIPRAVARTRAGKRYNCELGFSDNDRLIRTFSVRYGAAARPT